MLQSSSTNPGILGQLRETDISLSLSTKDAILSGHHPVMVATGQVQQVAPISLPASPRETKVTELVRKPASSSYVLEACSASAGLYMAF